MGTVHHTTSGQRLKVIHIWKDFDTYYGVHDQLLSLSRHLSRDEFDMNICIFNLSEENKLSKEFEKLDIPIHNLKVRWNKNPLLLGKLVKLLKKENPQVLQTYCLNTNTYGTIAGRLAGVPVIIRTELTLKDQAPSKLSRLRDRFLFPLNRILDVCSDCTVFDSEAVQREWVGEESSEKYRVIYSPFNYDKYQSYLDSIDSDSARPDGIRIGIIARLSVEKGHKDLLKAMPELLKKYPNIKLVIVGGGPLENEIKSYAHENALTNYVEFTGHINNVFHELNKMDLFVLPSLSEGLGIAIIEAMVMGLPVVATNVGGIPEVVQHGVTGILVPPHKPMLLADAITECLSNTEMMKEMGRRGRERALQIFHPAEFANKHQDLYRELVNRKLCDN